MRTVFAVATIVLVSCGTAGEPLVGAGWTAPAEYEFVLESSCGERDFLGRYHIVVEGEQVTEASGLDGYATRLLSSDEHRDLVPTLSELLREVKDAEAQGADVAETTFDESDGHPVTIEIDWDTDATDDEACYRVSQFSAPEDDQDADQLPTPSPSTTTSPSPAADTEAAVLTPGGCPPAADCLPSFHLDGVQYVTTTSCDQVAPSALAKRIATTARDAGTAVPAAVYTLEGFPVKAGIAVDWQCNDRALALPADLPDDREHALQQAHLRCETLVNPAPSNRCGLGGNAKWRVGDAWYDFAFAPFPEAIEAADSGGEAGGPAQVWRKDPLEVATRRFTDEGVCKDEQGTPCPWDVTLTQHGDDRAVIEGVVHPFPHVTWDIRIVVERLGEHSWWTTRMTIEPRPAE